MTRSSKWPCLTGTLLLASVAAANAVSLASFQFIASDGIPLGCIVAYNKPLLGCSDDDFGEGNTCSALCVRSMERIMDTLAGACGGVDPAKGSLLELAILGELLDALCPGEDDDDDDNTTTATSGRVTTTTVRSTTFSDTITTPTASNTRTTTFLTSTATLSPTSSAADPSTVTQSDTTTFILPTQTTTNNGGSGNGGGGLTGTTTAVATPGATTTAGGSNNDGGGEDSDFPGGAGGGSPFDPVEITSDGSPAASCSSLGWRVSIALAAGVAAGIFAL